MAKEARRYCLYISATDAQAVKHLTSIKRRLETPALLRDYPHLRPRMEKTRNAMTNWSRQRLVTDGGQVIEAVSLLGHMRGFKSEENIRPDFFVLDDIDADPSAESQDVVQKKLEVLRTEILPAGGEDTVVLFAQNLIHRDSICAQVMDYRADILSDRHFEGPFSLLKWYDADKVEIEGGGRKWTIIAGEPSDPAISLEYCERLLNRFGKEAFDRECQQDVEKVATDKDFREWDEMYHVATVSEVLQGFQTAGALHELKASGGRLIIPDRWEVGTGLDWGTTREHPSVFTAACRPDQRSPFSDIHFAFAEVCLPEYPFDAHVAPEPVSPGRVARAIRQWQRDAGIMQSQIRAALMSHEASAARNTFLIDLPEDDKVFFTKWQAAKGSGVPQIQNLLEIDRTKPHPFRRDPRTNEPLQGRPRLIFVVADGQGEIYVDSEGRLRVRGPKDAAGMARARFEMPLYSHRNSGKSKINDDFVDAFRGMMAKFAVQAGPLTLFERIEAELPESWRAEAAPKGEWEREGWEMAREWQVGKVRKRLESQNQGFDDTFEPKSPLSGVWGGDPWGSG